MLGLRPGLAARRTPPCDQTTASPVPEEVARTTGVTPRPPTVVCPARFAGGRGPLPHARKSAGPTPALDVEGRRGAPWTVVSTFASCEVGEV